MAANPPVPNSYLREVSFNRNQKLLLLFELSQNMRGMGSRKLYKLWSLLFMLLLDPPQKPHEEKAELRTVCDSLTQATKRLITQAKRSTVFCVARAKSDCHAKWSLCCSPVQTAEFSHECKIRVTAKTPYFVANSRLPNTAPKSGTSG